MGHGGEGQKLTGICAVNRSSERRATRAETGNKPKSRTEEADTMRKLWKDEEGLTTVEYALLLALVVVAGIAAWQGLGGSVRDAVTESSDKITETGASGT